MATSIRLDVKEHLLGWRNALISSARFRRWASRFPLTRPVARARAAETFQLVAGFVYSQVLAATVEAGLLARLANRAATTDELATSARLTTASAMRLLRAAAALRLVEPVGPDRWMLGRVGAAIAADPGIIAMIAHHHLLYRDLADPLSLLRGERTDDRALSAFWPYASAREGSVGAYSALMGASQPMVAEQAIGAYDFTRHRRMLDVGGGEGAFAAAIGRVAPRLERAVFDLPDVVARIADPTIARFAASFRTDAIPSGFDLITLVRIAHDHDDDVVAALFASIRGALAPGSRLVIVEPMAGPRGDAAMADAYFGMYLLAMGSGRARSPEALAAMLVTAGFASVDRRPTALPLIAQLLVASA